MARLMLQPTDLLLLTALVLLVVQGGRACDDRLPLLFPVAWLLGGMSGLSRRSELLLALPCLAAVTAIGLLTALGVRLRPVVFLVLSTGLAMAPSGVAGLAAAVVQGAALAGRKHAEGASQPVTIHETTRYTSD